MIYSVKYWCNRLLTEEIPVLGETEQYYKVEGRYLTVGYRKRLRKDEEGTTWTTDKEGFERIKNSYINDLIGDREKQIERLQNDIKKLKESL